MPQDRQKGSWSIETCRKDAFSLWRLDRLKECPEVTDAEVRSEHLQESETPGKEVFFLIFFIGSTEGQVQGQGGKCLGSSHSITFQHGFRPSANKLRMQNGAGHRKLDEKQQHQQKRPKVRHEQL